MALEYLKKARLTSTSNAGDVHDTVIAILDDIEAGGDTAALEYAAKFDKYEGNVLMTQAEIEAACAQVPEKLKADIRFAHANVRRFAEMQKSTVANVEHEVVPGMIAGQKAIPVDAAGCYVPGGRYSHIASAHKTVTPAKVAGSRQITACSPPRPEVGDTPATV
jgi:sulfopropanediol 3-dehydrogenase